MGFTAEGVRFAVIGSALSLMSVTATAGAEKLPWEFSNDEYQGFYLYGQLGHASANLSRGEAQSGLQSLDGTINAVWLEEGGEAWSIGGGYFLTDWFSMELGWIDLGSRSLKLNQAATYPDNGYKYYPQSGEGISLAVLGHIPLGAHFYLTPKLGVYVWEDESGIKSDADGTDIWYGAEVNYRLDEKLSIFAGWQQFDLPRQQVDFLSMGVRYQLGSKTPLPAPVKPVELKQVPVVAQELDSDSDGVLDKEDVCPDTPVRFAVDEHGCTRYKEELLEYRLVIYYDNDSSVIDDKYDGQIQELLSFMDEHNIKNIQVEGHTSAPGSELYNQRLSQQRAESVIDVLSEKYGMDKEIFIPVGKGESELLDTSDTFGADALNRRTEVAVGKTIRTEVLR